MLTCLQLEKSWHVVDGGEQKYREDESFRLDDLLLTKEGATHRDVSGKRHFKHSLCVDQANGTEVALAFLTLHSCFLALHIYDDWKFGHRVKTFQDKNSI